MGYVGFSPLGEDWQLLLALFIETMVPFLSFTPPRHPVKIFLVYFQNEAVLIQWEKNSLYAHVTHREWEGPNIQWLLQLCQENVTVVPSVC